MPALHRAASRRPPDHGSGRPLPTVSANAVIALSTSDCCAWPVAVPAATPAARSERIGSRGPPSSWQAGQPVSRAARASWLLAMACATADSPAARASASVSLAAASLGTLAAGSVASRLLSSWVASSHGGLDGSGSGGVARASSSSVRSHGGLDSAIGWPSASRAGAASGTPVITASAVSGATGGPSYTAKPSIIASMSAAIRSLTARFCTTVSVSSARSSPRPAPVRAETGKMGASCSPSASSRRRRSSSQSLACCGMSTSTWLSTTVNTSAWPASGIRYRLCTAASAYFCGSRTQMTMSARLDSRSTAAMDAVTTESWSGRSSRISPSRSDSPESRTLALANRWRRCTPSQSSSGAAPCMPHTHACTCRVIGRVTPGGENVAPDRALNSVDLPLPVPPARATTV